jgi:hypothetical protein
MRGFAAALLRQTGALVDDIAPDGLEVLAPPPVQAALGLGEFARLGFGATLPPSAQRVGIDGDWLERFARLLGPRGHWTRRVLVDDRRAPGDPQSLLARELLLDNATWRLLDVRPAWTRYLVLAFRAAAVSNDKRDFVLRIGINLATGAVVDGMADGAEGAPPDAAELPPDWPRARLLALVGRALPPRLDAALAPFLTGLRRRLGRDLDRLHQFHADLHREAMTRAEALAGSDPRRERERLRAEAIAREYHARLDDLRRQYAARVTVTWVQTEEVIAPVHRLAVQVRRRKGERTMLLDWNVPGAAAPGLRRRPAPGGARRDGALRRLWQAVLPRVPRGVPEMRPRSAGRPRDRRAGVGARQTSAVASISTSAAASTSRPTCTTDMVGKWRPSTRPYASPTARRERV